MSLGEGTSSLQGSLCDPASADFSEEGGKVTPNDFLKKGFATLICERFETGLAALRAGSVSVDACCHAAAYEWERAQPRHALYGVEQGCAEEVLIAASGRWWAQAETVRTDQLVAFRSRLGEQSKALFTYARGCMAAFARLILFELPGTQTSRDKKQSLLRLEDGSYWSEWSHHHDPAVTGMVVAGESLAYRTGRRVWFGWIRVRSDSWLFFCGQEKGFRSGSTLAASLAAAGFELDGVAVADDDDVARRRDVRA